VGLISKSHWKQLGMDKVCAMDSSTEFTDLDMLILAYEKTNPKNLAVLLK
jgi:hypothetical protein